MTFRTVRQAIALSSLLTLGSLTLPVSGAAAAAKTRPEGATQSLQIVAVYGEALVAGNRQLRAGATRDRQLHAGDTLVPGDELRTGVDGHVRFALPGGSSFTLQASSRLIVDRYRVLPAAGGIDASLRLDRGRIEAGVRGMRHANARFEVRTPVAVATAREALFRATADLLQRTATIETGEGSVQVAMPGGSDGVAVAAGHGARVVAGNPSIQARALLAGPRLWTGIQLVEQNGAEIHFSPLEGARMYRVIISPGSDLARHLVEEIVRIPRLRIAALADGDYFVRVRAIDDIGLEGIGTIARMRVQLRAEPPSLTSPPDRSRLYGRSTELAWLPDADAIGYVTQLAQDNAFRNQPREWTGLRETKLPLADLRPGTYYWRVASLLKNGSQSRLSAIRSFRLDSPPAPPAAPRVEGGMLRFSWAGLPGQKFVLQLAADSRFDYIVEERHTDRPAADLPLPLYGTYFARLRTTEPDGHVGPLTDATRIEIPRNAPRTSCLVEGDRGICAVYAPTTAPPR